MFIILYFYFKYSYIIYKSYYSFNSFYKLENIKGQVK